LHQLLAYHVSEFFDVHVASPSLGRRPDTKFFTLPETAPGAGPEGRRLVRTRPTLVRAAARRIVKAKLKCPLFSKVEIYVADFYQGYMQMSGSGHLGEEVTADRSRPPARSCPASCRAVWPRRRCRLGRAA